MAACCSCSQPMLRSSREIRCWALLGPPLPDTEGGVLSRAWG